MVTDSELQRPFSAEFNIDNQLVAINAFNASEAVQSLHGKSVNIIASGPSIAQMPFAELLNTATIFVNGSIYLTEQYNFTNVVGYVISDARFISHQSSILQKHYSGQPLYATVAVFEAMAMSHPDILLAHHKAMRVLYPIDRPRSVKTDQSLLSKLLFRQKWPNSKKPLSDFTNHPSFVIDSHHKPAAIGVSLDLTDGFVEAGTVAYVAAQLAFSRQAGAIHLYGIDLLNSSQPRFYENKGHSAPSKLSKAVNDRIVPSFNLLGRVYKERGVPVYNHSPVSKDLFDGLY